MSHLRLRLLTVVAALIALSSAGGANAASSELFLSEYIEGSSNNKALEIYNGTGASVSLAGYNVQVFFNGASTTTTTINLAGSIAAGGVHVIAHTSASSAISANQRTGSLSFNGDDAVVLRKGTTIIDVIGEIGFDPGAEWGAGLQSTADNTLQRRGSVTSGDTNGSDDFDPASEWDGFPTNTFAGLGSVGKPVVGCTPELAPTGFETRLPVFALDANARVTGLTATVTPSPSAGAITITDVVAASAAGGSATGVVVVSDAVPAGAYTVTVTATSDDSPAESGSCSFPLRVEAVRSIGSVQGPVTITQTGIFNRSPLAGSGGDPGQLVAVRGVVYEHSLARASGRPQHGFFVQNTAAQADADANTSDGIFVLTGGSSGIRNGYEPQVGDEVVITGAVTEFFNYTQLTSASLVSVSSSGVLDVDAVVPPFAADPPADAVEAGRYWERRESMRGRVPAGARVTDGLDHFPSSSDTEMWLIRGDNALGLRSNPFEQRVFRDAHPLDDVPGLVDNGNGFRIMVSSYGIRGASGDPFLLLSPSRTFDTVTNDLVGGVYVSFDKYSIAATSQPELSHGADPALNAPPTPGNRFVQYSVGDYNVENLYDYRDDPTDDCDFASNSGCPGVNPPFDYVPASNAVYQERLGLIAQQIVGDLHAPDILLVQEAEDQDICRVEAGELACGAVGGPDLKPDTLQELALRIASQGGPAYDAAYDRDGSDDRGIVAALMYRTDRVELLPATADHPVLGNSPDFTYRSGANSYNADIQNPKSLNAPLPGDVTGTSDGNEVYTRDPQVGFFRIWRTAVGIGAWTDVYAISNHFSSTPDSRVNQRREQAAYLAAIVDALGDARVVAGGDFNVYPRPDDPLNPPSDQLGPLYNSGLVNLWDTLVAQVPAAAYSYVFVGQAQTLDGQFVTPNLLAELEQTRVAHVNADFAADFPGDGARGLSDHDPLASRFELPVTLAGLDALLAYYCETGVITGKNTCAHLQHHLDQSKQVGDAQLEAFIEQVRDKTPRFITQAAADALVAEAELLLGSN